MAKRTLYSSNEGFTFVELMLAMTFVTFVIMASTFAAVQLGRQLDRVVNEREVQNSARVIMEDVTRAIRAANATDIEIWDGFTDPNAPTTYRLCVGDNLRYGWNMSVGGGTLSEELYGDNTRRLQMVRNNTTPTEECEDPILEHGGSDGTTVSLLQNGLTVQHFSVEPIAGSSSFRVKLVLSTYLEFGLDAEDDFAALGEDALCQPRRGSEHCYVASIETVVTARN